MRDPVQKSILALLIFFGILSWEPFGFAHDQGPGELKGRKLVLLTDPFLQLPTENGVHVVWFTEWQGLRHTVHYGTSLEMSVQASSNLLSRTAEDVKSHTGNQYKIDKIYKGSNFRKIWRHEASINGLKQGERVEYYVQSIGSNGTAVRSQTYTLQPLPAYGQPLKILLTSDHQSKPLTAANLEMVEKTVGIVDAVFFAGDLVNIPDRASEWFDDSRGSAFFPCLQGKGGFTLEKTFVSDETTYHVKRTYKGGSIIQHAPLFPIVGNHEVMGRYDVSNDLNFQFNDPQPFGVAEKRYEQLASLVNPKRLGKIASEWIENNSFNTITYREIFTLPSDGPAGEDFYALQFGDIYLIGLFATRIWRPPELGPSVRGKYRESSSSLNSPEKWGYGDFIFSDLQRGSEQYDWLVSQLESEAFKKSKYKVVLMHQAPHGIGANHIPVFAHPVQIIDRNDDGGIESIRYEYPINQDILFNDVMPLLKEAGVDIIHSGHSHLWYRMDVGGVAYIETSNVGNSYGCYVDGYKERGNIPDDIRFTARNYPKVGDPHGLSPILPNRYSPMKDENGKDLPCVGSNDLTVFTILDTRHGVLRSYVYDTHHPENAPRLFDELTLAQ